MTIEIGIGRNKKEDYKEQYNALLEEGWTPVESPVQKIYVEPWYGVKVNPEKGTLFERPANPTSSQLLVRIRPDLANHSITLSPYVYLPKKPLNTLVFSRFEVGTLIPVWRYQ